MYEKSNQFVACCGAYGFHAFGLRSKHRQCRRSGRLCAKAIKLPEFEPLDRAEVEEASAGDFTYELIEGLDPLAEGVETIKAVRLTSYTGDDKIINIPDKLDGYWVYRINTEVFEGNTEITHVRPPKYLNMMTCNWNNNISFSDCTSLLQVEMPLDPYEIPSGMFRGCASLHQVQFNRGLVISLQSWFVSVPRMYISYIDRISGIGDFA